MSFGILTVIVLAGLVGPLCSSSERVLVPVVVGELIAGLVVGKSGFGWVDPERLDDGVHGLDRLRDADVRRRHARADPSARAGAPARSRNGGGEHRGRGCRRRRLRSDAGWPACRTPASTPSSLPAARRPSSSLRSTKRGSSCCPSGSRSPRRSRSPTSRRSSRCRSRSSRTGPSRAVLGARGRLGCALALLGAVRALRGAAWIVRVRRLSKRRAWALDLRIALLVLFALCWLATRIGTSILIAGFAVGLVVAADRRAEAAVPSGDRRRAGVLRAALLRRPRRTHRHPRARHARRR